MDCSKVKELASEYIEGTLPGPLARAVGAHLESCRDCASEVESLRSLWTELEGLPAVETPPFFHENIMAAVERSERKRREGSLRALLPRLVNVAFGTLVMGGAVAALAWTLLLPKGDLSQKATLPLTNVLPGVGSPDTGAAAAAATSPRLSIGRVETQHPKYGPAYKFIFLLDHALQGTARVQVLPDDTLTDRMDSVRFRLQPDVPQPLVVPLKNVRPGGTTLNLYVYWTAAGEEHHKYLFLPLPRTDAVSEVQSFGLPPLSVAAAAREVAAHYHQPVTVEDIPEDGQMTVIARQETAKDALQRALAARGMRVSQTPAGILIEPERTLGPAPVTIP